VTRQSLIFIAAFGSFALLAAAFLFQALGWAPCTMCLWQRWPHAAAVAIGALGVVLPTIPVAVAGGLTATTTAGLGLYHSGVERDWWEGPAACSGDSAGLSGLSADSLLPGASDVPALVLCDAFTPFLFGLTMANWNLLASLGLAAVWALAALRPAAAR
jgi:disulfide bond formation protein DsbB